VRSCVLGACFASLLAACDATAPIPAIPEIPDPPTGFLRFVALDAGPGSVCGITADSLTYCWGAGRLNFEPDAERPKLIAVPKLGTISAGTHQEVNAREMLCGAIATTEIVCLGSAARGLDTVPGSAGFTHLSVGGAICALAPDATARCWRFTAYDAPLGVPSSDIALHGIPVEVSGGLGYKSLSVGQGTACAVSLAGEAYCWGNNFALLVPDDTSTYVARLPTRVIMPTQLPIVAVTTLETHSCALTVERKAYCWGMAARGRLGQSAPATVECPGVLDVTTGQLARCVAHPIAVSGSTEFASIAGGTHHTCGLDLDGRAFCWGSGTWGELGNGRYWVDNWAATPQPVAGTLRFRSITTGQFFTCGIATNDATYCWGTNQRGQLGAGLALGYVATVPNPVATP